ncbi:MAG: hypothetical protein IKZ88_02880 [Neisseriaceae bacterium]|nr:hypothetical protein [Neisseriaceae bacterium]
MPATSRGATSSLRTVMKSRCGNLLNWIGLFSVVQEIATTCLASSLAMTVFFRSMPNGSGSLNVFLILINRLMADFLCLF